MEESTWLFGEFFGHTNCSHFQVCRPSVFQRNFYRGDKNKHTLIGSFTIDTNDMIVHLIAGVPGKNNDGGIVKESTLPELLEKYSGQIMADGGYPGRASIVIPFSDDHGNEILQFRNQTLRSRRTSVENAIRKVKSFGALKHKFHHNRQLQPLILTACAGIYNMKRIKKLKEIREKERKMLEQERMD